jgi:erythromycin esterase-like protein
VDAILKALDRTHPVAAARTRELYGCLKAFGRDEKAYARALVDSPEGCETEVVEALKGLLRLRLEAEAERGPKSRRSQEEDEEIFELFNIEQNARVARDAELYYRTMVAGTEDSWNVRDRHMLDTLERLLAFYGPSAKAVVWAHNQHVGDYRGSAMLKGKQVSLGGLARDRWGADAVSLVGFGTYRGEVMAARAWGEAPRTMQVPPGRPDSYDAIFHSVAQDLDADALYLRLRGNGASESALGKERRAQRAVGVVYYPEHEHFGNYTDTALAKRYDAFVHIDSTTALTPLEAESRTAADREVPPMMNAPEL